MTESDWGEDSWEAPPPPPPAEDEPPASAAAGIPASFDVAGAAAAAVDAAVKGAVRKEVAAIATKAVADALTEELVEKLREQAETSAAAAVEEQLSPPEPEPEPEPELAAEEDEEKPPELVYGSVDEFLREYLRHVYRRATSDHRVWAARWWEYDEAVIRLEALWRAWEHLRLDPSTGMSVWWRDHADHHMAVLMDPEGPFAAADHYGDVNEAGKGEPLPYEPPPAGLFPDVRTQQNSAELTSRPEPPTEPELLPPPPPED